MALISIVVPAYNAETYLPATLDSVLAQTHEDWECVVVDDGSADGTRAVADRYAERDGRIRALSVAQGGVSAARNAGFRASNPRADYCTFMDSDDVWVADALETLLVGAARDPGTIGAHGLAEFVDETGTIIRPGEFSSRGRHRKGVVGRRIVEVSPDAPTDFSVLLFGTSVFPPGLILVERQAYLQAGPFDQSLTVGEEWEMLVRVSRFGPLAYVPSVILFYRRHADNAGAKGAAPAEVHKALCQNFHSPSNTPAQRELARRGWRARQRRRMGETITEAWANRREPAKAATSLGQFGFAVIRYADGRPRPVVRGPAPTW